MQIESSKTDPFREGDAGYLVTATDPSICPVTTGSVDGQKGHRQMRNAPSPLFPHGNKSSKFSTKSTYVQMLGWMQRRAELKHLTGHSWRSGHMSIALWNGADPVCVQMAGRWQTNGSFLRYIDRGKDQKLQSARQLGL